jgi:hypothetical protein
MYEKGTEALAEMSMDEINAAIAKLENETNMKNHFDAFLGYRVSKLAELGHIKMEKSLRTESSKVPAADAVAA